jgi:hypothetical protein
MHTPRLPHCYLKRALTEIGNGSASRYRSTISGRTVAPMVRDFLLPTVARNSLAKAWCVRGSLYSTIISFIQGGTMEFRRAAGIYVGGISLILGGPLVSFIGNTFGTWYSVRNPTNNLSGVFIGIAVFGVLLGIVGFFMLVVAAHRALVKIDALPARLPAASRENWTADHR